MSDAISQMYKDTYIDDVYKGLPPWETPENIYNLKIKEKNYEEKTIPVHGAIA